MPADRLDNYISLQEASKYCDYSQEYLSLRARQKKLKAVKIGRNWVTTKEWLDEYLGKFEKTTSKYISLQEAQKYCDYTQEYLSLRARQKKLKAVKIGRNWVTTKEWLDEYLKIAEEYKQQIATKEVEVKVLPEILPPAEKLSLPQFPEKKIPQIAGPFARPKLKFVPAFSIALIFILLIAASFSAIYFRKNIYDSASAVKNIVQKEILKIQNNTEKGYLAFSQYIKKLIPQPTREGLVVLPSTERDEEVKRKIRESFSDEVKVRQDDQSSGIITPVFKEGDGEKYLYLLVPVR